MSCRDQAALPAGYLTGACLEGATDGRPDRQAKPRQAGRHSPESGSGDSCIKEFPARPACGSLLSFYIFFLILQIAHTASWYFPGYPITDQGSAASHEALHEGIARPLLTRHAGSDHSSAASHEALFGIAWGSACGHGEAIAHTFITFVMASIASLMLSLRWALQEPYELCRATMTGLPIKVGHGQPPWNFPFPLFVQL